MKALIDGDMIAYICGFASDKNVYQCSDGREFQYKKDANAHQDACGFAREDITKTVHFEPVEHCLHSVKLMLKDIEASTDASESKVFLSGPANFRDDIYPKYKANRDRSHKPHWYKEIREYMEKYWKADIVTGVEADDAMGWAQYKGILSSPKLSLEDSETVICTLDKDLNMIPGWHYNWRANEGKGTMYLVNEEESHLYFFLQWLTGDTSDNIPGLPKVGEKTAQKILQPFVDANAGPRELYNVIHAQYNKFAIDTKMMHMIGDLLWIQRKPMQSWDQYMGLSKLRQENE